MFSILPEPLWSSASFACGSASPAFLRNGSMVENSKTLFECRTISDQFNVIIGLEKKVNFNKNKRIFYVIFYRTRLNMSRTNSPTIFGKSCVNESPAEMISNDSEKTI